MITAELFVTQQQQRFLACLDPLYGNLERYALSLTRNREDARELVSETIAQAWEGFHRLQDERAFLSFLFSIASRSYHRRRLRSERSELRDPQMLDELYASQHDSSDNLALQELQDAINQLPDSYREIIVMAELLEMSHKEIQAILGISIANIKIRAFRAKQLLRKALNDNERVSTAQKPRKDQEYTTR